jgi:signal transduction histidine kinase
MMADSLEKERDSLARLAEEQAALRRVAILVASGVPPRELFAAVSQEVGRLLSADIAGLGRYEDGGEVTELAAWISTDQYVPRVGSRWALGGMNVPTLVAQTAQPARIDSHADASGPLGVLIREIGIRSLVGTPIVVEGRLWGMMVAGSTRRSPLPADTEARLASFTELVATAIANAAGRAALARLAEEQAALRRVATLVARAGPPEELFAAVTQEVGQLLGVERASMGHYESDGTVNFLTSWTRTGPRFPTPSRWRLGGNNVPTLVAETCRPARLDSYADASGPIGLAARERGLQASVGTPIVVEGRLWGVMVANPDCEEPLPANTEARLASFTELVATAIANAESHARLARLAEEQAALRRVATLVARAAPPEELFAAVTAEVGELLPVERTGMALYEPDGTVTAVATWSSQGDPLPMPRRMVLGGKNIPTLVAQTGRPVRLDSYADASGPIGMVARELGMRASSGAVGTPIVVDGRVWGVMTANADREQLLPSDTEARLTDFTELLATAIANAQSRGELAASRARIVAAADETRRRIERNLHDGAQQRLVSLGLELRAAQAAVPPELSELGLELSRVAEGLSSAQEELREIARGIHPAMLAEGGLGPALKTVARRSRVPVELDVRADGRLPHAVEVAAYYVVSETLANADKHARASVVRVEAEAAGGSLRLDISDDGVGGADSSRGSGLAGLKDRVEAIGGMLTVRSAVGAGTAVSVELPLREAIDAAREQSAPAAGVRLHGGVNSETYG